MKSNGYLNEQEQILYEHLLGLLSYIPIGTQRQKCINTLDDLITLLIGRYKNERQNY